MSDTCSCTCKNCSGKGRRRGGHGASSGGYGLAMLGAAIYYLHTADTFGEGVLGLLKALVWPAFLVYHVLEHIHA